MIQTTHGFTLFGFRCVVSILIDMDVLMKRIKLATVLNKLPQNIPAGEKTEIPQCMPEDAKRDNVVEAYQEYYRKYKSDFAKWTDREVPEFMNAQILSKEDTIC